MFLDCFCIAIVPLESAVCVYLVFSPTLSLTRRKLSKMGQPSFQASNAIIYLTYGAFLYASYLGYFLRLDLSLS